jgi:hypothetical protein
MARRASSSAHSSWILITFVLSLGAGAGGYVLFNRVSDPYRTMSKLPTEDYLTNSNSLRGNTYKLEAVIAGSIDWSPTAGRLFSVECEGSGLLAILVPPQFSNLNIERGQRYLFKIVIGDKGILSALDVKKS